MANVVRGRRRSATRPPHASTTVKPAPLTTLELTIASTNTLKAAMNAVGHDQERIFAVAANEVVLRNGAGQS